VDNVGGFITGLGLGILLGIGAAVVLFVVRAFTLGAVAPAVVAGLACLAGYLWLTYRQFHDGKTWYGFGLLVVLLLVVPALTTACFPEIQGKQLF
jgi:hypothetical protein